MKDIREFVVECPEKEFRCIEFEFSYASDINDKKLLDELTEEGKKLALHVNPTLARDAARKRRKETVETNSIAGIIAEYCWRYWLNVEAKRLKINVLARSAVFKSIDKHVDISIIYPDNTLKTVEVRSSFPYTGLQNAVCKVFDIIGWYVNPVKTKEIRKDFYARVLYPFHISEFRNRLRGNSFSTFLAGGATRSLLEKSPYSKNKVFIPRDDIDALVSSQLGKYQVIKPIINAYDTVNITNLILEGKT